MADDHYLRWHEPDLIKRFEKKTGDSFFASEEHFLADVADRVSSVLDIGCASGRYIELLSRYLSGFSYTGIDIVAGNIDIARRLYPEHRFQVGNALDLPAPGRFDLVNATGVMQHEPRFRELLARMIDWSKSYVLADVKLAEVEGAIVDLDESHTRAGDNRLYYIVMSWPWLKEFLLSLNNVSSAVVFGYQTPVPDTVRLPRGVTRLVSAGLFLTRGPGPLTDIRVDLPDFIIS